MINETIIYKESYQNLPQRFVDKIEFDLTYIQKANLPALRKVFLFGSCAREDYNEHSDVDLLIVTEKKLTDRMQAAKLRWTLDAELNGVRTDIIFMNLESITEDTFFKNQVNRDKKLLLEVLDKK